MSDAPRPRPSTLRFRLAGVPVAVHPSFWIVTLVLGSSARDAAAIAAWVATVFVSVLLHELGHAMAARAFGRGSRIELHTMGGTTHPEPGAPFTTRQTVLIALAGPCAGALVGAVVFGADAWLGPWDARPIVRVVVADLLWINWGYGLLNLLPIVPLDGGLAMTAVLERVRGRPSPTLVAAVSLAGAALLAAFAVATRALWALFMLGWLAVSHARTLIGAWQARADAALEPRFAAIDAALARRDFATALALAEALRPRMRSPRGRTRAALALAHIHYYAGRADLAASALDGIAHGWRPGIALEAGIRLSTGAPERALARLREQPDAARDPALAPLLARALTATGDDAGAVQLAVDASSRVDRAALFELASRLFDAGRFEDSARVARVAFERFGRPDDAYNVACSFARLDRSDDAMSWLARAIEAGYADGAHLDVDDDLASLRTHATYPALRASLGLVNATTAPYDSHLAAGNPAIDTGVTESDVTRDFDGTARPQGAAADVGAFESRD